MGVFEKLGGRRKTRAEFSSKLFSSSKKIVRPNRRETMDPGKKRPSRAGVWFLWSILLFVGAYVFLFSSFLSIGSVSISGAEKVSEQDMRELLSQQLSGKYFGFWSRNNFFAVQPEKIRTLLLEQYPLFKDVAVTRRFPDGLRIDVEERDKMVLWRSGDQTMVVREDGSVFQSDQALSDENAPYALFVTDMSAQPIGPDQRIADEHFVPFVTEIGEMLKDRIGIDADKEYLIPSRFAEELRIRTSEGWELYVNTGLPIGASLNTLALLFEKELPKEKRGDLRYIDLRVENRVYYTFRDAPANVIQAPPAADVQSQANPTMPVKEDGKKKKK